MEILINSFSEEIFLFGKNYSPIGLLEFYDIFEN